MRRLYEETRLQSEGWNVALKCDCTHILNSYSFGEFDVRKKNGQKRCPKNCQKRFQETDARSDTLDGDGGRRRYAGNHCGS